MTAPHQTHLTAEYDSTDQARAIERSIRPEIDDIEGDRTTARLCRNGQHVELTVKATDLVALRAGINTWLTLRGVAEDSFAGLQ
ncbi:KEOPS complex subunit Pcc1 [Haloarcula vallismortis]|uniref:KEOPS complex Pcc1-like subunit n=2 Tax=Haloarcula vallismortis TaxID=28442 RepID=M0JCG5_HALVA|nr:KEOPS complex subunit Pcc1 [Haloarcula vallismortis]EMA06666.1 KEOPS complex Pcc1-like subunit [Haloarcula vallismortis ATCC 29715]SDW62563.1 KEOPS complex subunit Pcc1 [Haloarcula vallismortis]